MTDLPRPTALKMSMTNSGLTYLCPLPRSNISPLAGRFSCFPAVLRRELRWMERWSWLTQPGRRGGEERSGAERRAGPGGCRRCAGWLPREDRRRGTGLTQLRHVTSDLSSFFFLNGNTTWLLKRADLAYRSQYKRPGCASSLRNCCWRSKDEEMGQGFM